MVAQKVRIGGLQRRSYILKSSRNINRERRVKEKGEEVLDEALS
jgi:hypothetical protein